MHRRSNSYSQGTGVAPFWSNAGSSEAINTSFVRGTLERRSTGRKPVVGKGYAAVTITLPAAVKFAVSEEPDMSLRPRSPPRFRNGDTELQQLDQTLSFLREQLLGLRTDRTLLAERLNSLNDGIFKTEEDLRKQQTAVKKSPGTPLRRIHSMDTKSGSRVTLSTNSSIDLFDEPAMEILENSDSESSSPSEGSPVIRVHRHFASGSSHTLPRSYSPRPDRAMADVPDLSYKSDSQYEANSLLSPQSPDGSAKVLVSPRKSYSVGRRGSASGLRYTPSPCSTPLEEIKEGVSSAGANVIASPQHTEKTGPRKDSLSGSLLSLPQCLLSPDGSHVDPINPNDRWKSHNVIMRVSSATGQLEEVHPRSQTLTKMTAKILQQRHASFPASSPFSYSMMNLNFEGEDKGDTKIMNLSEEPQLVRRCNTLSRSTLKRRSIVLDSVSTDV